MSAPERALRIGNEKPTVRAVYLREKVAQQKRLFISPAPPKVTKPADSESRSSATPANA